MNPEIAFRMKVTDAAADATPLRDSSCKQRRRALVFPLFNDGSFNFNEQQRKNPFPTNDAPSVYVLIMYTQHYSGTSEFPLYELFTN